MKKILFLVILQIPTLAQAEWTWVSTRSRGEVTIYVDTATIKRNGSVAEFATLFDYATVRTLSGAPFQSATMQDEIDCVAKRTRTLAVSSYSGPMGGGHVVSTATGYAPWTPIGAKTIAAATLKLVCKKKPPAMDVESTGVGIAPRRL